MDKTTRSFLVFLSSSKNIAALASVAALLALFLLLFKWCGREATELPLYHITQESAWSGVSLMGKERSVSAFSGDLLKAVAEQQKVRFRVNTVPSRRELLTLLDEQEVDGVLTALEPSFANKQKYLFSDPYLRLGDVLILRASLPLRGFNDQTTKLIGVHVSDLAILGLESQGNFEFRVYDNILRALSDLEQSKIDGAIFSAMPAYLYTRGFYDRQLKIATTPLTQEGLRLVTLKGHKGEKIIQLFNDGLKSIKADGSYDRMIDQWGLVNPERLD